jgi:acetyl-CoA synthetase
MDAKALPPNLANYEETYASFSWQEAEKEVEWFNGHKINAAYNAVERHCLTKRKDKTALIWISQDKKTEFYSFADLAKLTNKFANVLVNLGIKKQERVFIFMPRLPELYISFLGAVKAGCVASTLFSAFGPEALRDRLKDGEATALVTVPDLLPRVEAVITELPALKHIILVESRNNQSSLNLKQANAVAGKAAAKVKESLRSYEKLMQQAKDVFSVLPMQPTDYAFMLYTSGTTGKAKGGVHCHQAIVQEHITAKWVLDLKEDDIYWCTADPGWVTGIAYGILGSWSNGVTSVVYSGRFNA